ncbi:MAG: branched-chain amino acid ABC transporter permease [Limnochordales bacterium]
MLFLAELAINGGLVGLMYALVATGIVLIYKSSGVVNLAQGAFVMAGGYFAWLFVGRWQLPVPVGVLLAGGAMGLLGWITERFALRRMIGQPLIMILMLTLAVEVVLRGTFPPVFGVDTKPIGSAAVQAPIWWGDILINRTYLVGGVTAVAVVVLLSLFFRSRPGIAMRAVSDDHLAAWAVGIPVERVVAFSWAASGSVAAVTGLLWGSVQGVDWSLSLLLIKALAVAVLGGLDSLAGVVLAGLFVGIAENVVSGYLDPVVGGGTKTVVTAAVIFFTILFRPYGLFGREVIERI